MATRHFVPQVLGENIVIDGDKFFFVEIRHVKHPVVQAKWSGVDTINPPNQRAKIVLMGSNDDELEIWDRINLEAQISTANDSLSITATSGINHRYLGVLIEQNGVTAGQIDKLIVHAKK